MTSTPPVTERERELEQDLSDLTKMYETCHRERNALAAQVEIMRERMNRARYVLTDGKPTPHCNWGVLSTEDIPHLSAEILRQRDAKILRDAAERIQPDDSFQDDWFKAKASSYAMLMRMAAELNGETK